MMSTTVDKCVSVPITFDRRGAAIQATPKTRCEEQGRQIGQEDTLPTLRQIDEITPEPELLEIFSRVCRVNPARLERLSLKFRHPNRSHDWISAGAGSGISVCLACYDPDVATGEGWLYSGRSQAGRAGSALGSQRDAAGPVPSYC